MMEDLRHIQPRLSQEEIIARAEAAERAKAAIAKAGGRGMNSTPFRRTDAEWSLQGHPWKNCDAIRTAWRDWHVEAEEERVRRKVVRGLILAAVAVMILGLCVLVGIGLQ